MQNIKIYKYNLCKKTKKNHFSGNKIINGLIFNRSADIKYSITNYYKNGEN